jgi:hypothetical protein
MSLPISQSLDHVRLPPPSSQCLDDALDVVLISQPTHLRASSASHTVARASRESVLVRPTTPLSLFDEEDTTSSPLARKPPLSEQLLLTAIWLLLQLVADQLEKKFTLPVDVQSALEPIDDLQRTPNPTPHLSSTPIPPISEPSSPKSQPADHSDLPYA